MIINMKELTITRDEHEDKICILTDDIMQFSKSGILIDFSDGVLRTYTCFKYSSYLENFEIHIPVFGVTMNPNKLPAYTPTNKREELGLTCLSWLNTMFSELRNTKTHSSYASPQTNIEESYKKIGFLYSVIDILKEYIDVHLDRQYDTTDFTSKFDFILMYCQMPWLDNFFGGSEPFECNVVSQSMYDERNGSYGSLDNHKSPILSMVGSDLNECIDDLLNKNNIPTNKRLKRIIFKNIARKTNRKNTIIKSTLSNSIELSYRAESLLSSKELPNGTHMEMHYECRALLDMSLDYIVFLSKAFPIDVTCDMLEIVYELKYILSMRHLVNDEKVFNFLKMFSLEKQKRFIKEEFAAKDGDSLVMRRSSNYLVDSANMFNDFKDVDKIPDKLKDKYPDGLKLPKKIQGIKELHDKLSVSHNEIQMCANNKEINYTKEELLINKLKYKDITIILPHDTATIALWGKQLKHCIASYAYKAVSKESILLAVHVKDELKYNAELSFGKNKEGNCKFDIKQIQGLLNRDSPTSEESIIINSMLGVAEGILNNSIPDYIDQTKPSDLSLEQLRERIHDFYSLEEQSENGTNLESNENLQNKNQDQQAIRDAQ